MRRTIAIAAALLSIAACNKGDREAPSADTVVVQPPTPPPETAVVNAKNGPGKGKENRYILISGDSPRPGCRDGGDGFQYCR